MCEKKNVCKEGKKCGENGWKGLKKMKKKCKKKVKGEKEGVKR